MRQIGRAKPADTFFRKRAVAPAARKSIPCKGFTCASALIFAAPIPVSSPVFAFQICGRGLAFEPNTIHFAPAIPPICQNMRGIRKAILFIG
jgi:hypothetical protein